MVNTAARHNALQMVQANAYEICVLQIQAGIDRMHEIYTHS